MAVKALPSQEVLRQLLRFEAQTGKLFWRARRPEHFSPLKQTPGHAASMWNSRYAGQEAFTCLNDAGYKTGRIFNNLMRAHRVIYALHFGAWPDAEIDHINGVRADNRIENLRPVSRTENSHNVAVHRDSGTGLIGISWYPRLNKWCARICVNGVRTHIGVFACIGQAIRARKAAEITHGFHENHGRAA